MRNHVITNTELFNAGFEADFVKAEGFLGIGPGMKNLLIDDCIHQRTSVNSLGCCLLSQPFWKRWLHSEWMISDWGGSGAYHLFFE